MTDELRPALDAAEWAVALDRIRNEPHPETIATGLDSPNGAERALRHLRIGKGRDVNAVRVALHNAARADDDPGKIVPDVLVAFEQVIAHARGGATPAALQYADRLLAALRAILPPEPADDA